jgi:nucleoside-diphosphate kinase
MSEGPVVPIVIEGEGAIARVREIMGATNPANAAAGTIRKDFAESVERNIVHGSDSPESAACEIPFFFSAIEIL